MKDTAILLLDCPADQKGVVAAITNLIYRHNAYLLNADQHLDSQHRLFLMRVEWKLNDSSLDLTQFEHDLDPIAERFHMRWRLARSSSRLNVAIFVSKYDHCLADLLYRHQIGELQCNIPLVVSNHRIAQPLVDFYHVPFHHILVDPTNKAAAERQQLALLDQHNIDLIVLARYMQVLSPDFVARYPGRIINVHHSFLPAFSGARPYQRAFERGVKIIGATSHYVTEILDEGPIIEQDVVRVSHRDDPNALTQKGRDLEKGVLSRAVQWHVEHRVLVYANRTVVFA